MWVICILLQCKDETGSVRAHWAGAYEEGGLGMNCTQFRWQNVLVDWLSTEVELSCCLFQLWFKHGQLSTEATLLSGKESALQLPGIDARYVIHE